MMNPAPFPTIVNQYAPMAMCMAYRILGSQDAAADAIQEGLFKAYQAIASFEGGNLRAWFMRIVANTCFDLLRYQKRHPTRSLEQFIEEHDDEQPMFVHCPQAIPDQQFLQTEALQAILQIIEQLPDCYRLVLQRIDVEGYGYAEVAKQLQLPMGTIKSRLFRARVIVRDQLVEAGIVTCEGTTDATKKLSIDHKIT